jgi:hypothetical protein
LTVAATTRRAGPYAGNGVATTFDFEFKVFAKTDIAVVLADEIGTETELVLDSDYSVALNADQNADPGGTITYPISGSPLATGEVLAIVGDLAYSQTTQLPNGGAYNASVVERALDRITILVQQILETANRGVQLAVTAATDGSSRLPAPVANFLVAWNPTATALVNVDPAVVQGSQAFASWTVDTFDGTGTVDGEYALTGNAAGIGNIDVSVAGITQRGGIDFTYYNNVVTSVAAWPTGTDNVLIRYGEAVAVADVPVESAMITDSTTVGRAVLTAVDAGAARTAIGITATGSAIVTALTTAAARLALGITAFWDSILTAATLNDARAALMQLPPVRQTVLSGPVDSNGFASFGGSTGSTTVTAAGTLVATAANGVVGDRIGTTVNPSWTGLSTNGTIYLTGSIAADGSITRNARTLQPIYQWGGTPSITNGQLTFNIQEMKMYLGNGSVANQVHEVVFGEVTVSGGVVTAITWYALMGRYQRTQTMPAANTPLSFAHNLGVKPDIWKMAWVCGTAQAGLAVGDEVDIASVMYNTPPNNQASTMLVARMSATYLLSGTAVAIYQANGGGFLTITPSQFTVKLAAQRGW